MICTTCYDSPLGKLTLAGKNNKLICLWIEGQKHFFGNFKDKIKKKVKSDEKRYRTDDILHRQYAFRPRLALDMG